MLFQSFTFAAFLAAAVGGFYAVPKKGRLAVLLILFRVGRSVCGHLAAEFCVSDVGLCPFSGKRRRQDEAPFADRSVPFFSADFFGSV